MPGLKNTVNTLSHLLCVVLNPVPALPQNGAEHDLQLLGSGTFSYMLAKYQIIGIWFLCRYFFSLYVILVVNWEDELD